MYTSYVNMTIYIYLYITNSFIYILHLHLFDMFVIPTLFRDIPFLYKTVLPRLFSFTHIFPYRYAYNNEHYVRIILSSCVYRPNMIIQTILFCHSLFIYLPIYQDRLSLEDRNIDRKKNCTRASAHAYIPCIIKCVSNITHALRHKNKT